MLKWEFVLYILKMGVPYFKTTKRRKNKMAYVDIMNCTTMDDIRAAEAKANPPVEKEIETNANVVEAPAKKILVPERKNVPAGADRVTQSVKMSVKNELVKVAKETIDLLSQAVAADGLLVCICIRDKDKLTYHQSRWGLATEDVLKSVGEIKNLLVNSLIE